MPHNLSILPISPCRNVREPIFRTAQRYTFQTAFRQIADRKVAFATANRRVIEFLNGLLAVVTQIVCKHAVVPTPPYQFFALTAREATST